MRHHPLGRSLAAGVKAVQLLLYIFIAIYAFAGWTFAGNLITLKSVVLVLLVGALLPRLVELLPRASRPRARRDRLILASL